MGNKVAAQTIDVTEPAQLINAINNINKYQNKAIPSLREFGEKMNNIYKGVIHNA
jgi:hypothetical protein